MKEPTFLAFVLLAVVSLTFGAVGVVAQDVRYDFDKDQIFPNTRPINGFPLRVPTSLMI